MCGKKRFEIADGAFLMSSFILAKYSLSVERATTRIKNFLTSAWVLGIYKTEAHPLDDVSERGVVTRPAKQITTFLRLYGELSSQSPPSSQ